MYAKAGNTLSCGDSQRNLYIANISHSSCGYQLNLGGGVLKLQAIGRCSLKICISEALTYFLLALCLSIFWLIGSEDYLNGNHNAKQVYVQTYIVGQEQEGEGSQ